MITCGEHCDPVCDVCRHFAMKLAKGYPPGAKIAKDWTGHCAIHNKTVGAFEFCEQFHCFRVKQKGAAT